MRPKRPFFSIVLLFIIFNGVIVAGRHSLESGGFDQEMLIYGNILLLGATFLSYLLAMRGLKATNPNSFVRSIMASVMLKMIICIAAAIIYILLHRNNVNKPSLFTLMGMYLIYTFLEVGILMKISRKRADA